MQPVHTLKCSWNHGVNGTAEHCCICIPRRACVERFVDLLAARGRVVICRCQVSKGTYGSGRGEARLTGVGEPTGLQCAAQALPLRPPSVVAESAGSGQNVHIWVGVNAGLHPLLTTRGSHTHTKKVPISFHSLLSHQKVVGGGDQRQLMDRTLQIVPRAQFDFNLQIPLPSR